MDPTSHCFSLFSFLLRPPTMQCRHDPSSLRCHRPRLKLRLLALRQRCPRCQGDLTSRPHPSGLTCRRNRSQGTRILRLPARVGSTQAHPCCRRHGSRDQGPGGCRRCRWSCYGKLRSYYWGGYCDDLFIYTLFLFYRTQPRLLPTRLEQLSRRVRRLLKV